MAEELEVKSAVDANLKAAASPGLRLRAQRSRALMQT